MVPATCLSDEQMSAYLQGRLPEPESKQLEGHLASCTRCEACVEELERSGDWLTRHLRLTPETQPKDDRWENWLERLREIPIKDIDVEQSATAIRESTPPTIYHYELGEQIGQGGMGVVYRSHHPQLHRPVAIKLLSASRAGEASAVGRFQREMRAAGGLDHPGIVRALDAGVWEGTYYFVMEYIEGTDLSRLVHQHGPLGVADACALVIGAADALQYAHDHQVLHRDIKPSNLILTKEGTVKILDFGLARVESAGLGGHDATTMGRLVGTLDYLSPEQAAGEQPIDERSDVYGLGATLFRLLTGRPPNGFSGQMPLLGFLKVLTENEPPSVDEIRGDVSKPLSEVIARLVARRPEDRPRSAKEAAELLAPFASGSKLSELGRQTTAFRPTGDSGEPLWPGPDEETIDQRKQTPKTGDAPRAKRVSLIGAGLILLATLLGGAGGFGGLTFWLQSGEGTIKVESEIKDISLQLLSDGEIAKAIEVKTGEDSVRVKVGQYQLRLEGAVDSVRLDTEVVTLMRGDTRVVRITREVTPQIEAQPAAIAGVETSKPMAPVSAKEPADRVRDHLGLLERQWKELAASLGEENQATVDAFQRYSAAKQEILQAVNGEDADARTSRGRTYYQWTDIVLRETNPQTVVEGIKALSDLSSFETHEETLATFSKVAAWNESRAERLLSDVYIGMLNTSEPLAVATGPGTRGRSVGFPGSSSRKRHDVRWETVFGRPDADWRAIVDALTDAISELPGDVVAKWMNRAMRGGLRSSAENLTLMCIAKAGEENASSNKLRVQKLILSGTTPEVKALAYHVWLKQMAGDPNKLFLVGGHYSVIPPSPYAVRKAAFATLLLLDKIPDGAAMGQLAGSLLVEEPKLYHAGYYGIVQQGVHDRESFIGSERHKLLLHTGRELARQLKDSPAKIAHAIAALELLRTNHCAGFLEEDARRMASEGLQELLESQLRRRSQLKEVLSVTESYKRPILYSAMTLAVLEGKVPEELLNAESTTAQEQQLDRLKEKMFDEESRTEVIACLLVFPLETTRQILEVCSERIDGAKSDDNMSNQMRSQALGSILGLLQQLDPGFVAVIASQDPEKFSGLPAMGRVLDRATSGGQLKTLQLQVPLAQLADKFLTIANQESIDEHRGLVLRLAQLGGVDQDALLTLIFDETATADKSAIARLGRTPTEFSWLLECLANTSKNDHVDLATYQAVDQRLSKDSTLSRSPDLMERCVLAALEIRDRVESTKEGDMLLRLGLGVRVRGRSQIWGWNRSSNRSSQWQIIAGTVPDTVVRRTLESIVASPPLDKELLEDLKSKRSRIAQYPQFSIAQPAIDLLTEAITSIAVAMEKNEAAENDGVEDGTLENDAAKLDQQ
ncbi:MAG: protein kinase [Planctomycetota bacterium]